MLLSSGSQNNLCNGGVVTTTMGQGLVPKVQNNSPNGFKKPTVSKVFISNQCNFFAIE